MNPAEKCLEHFDKKVVIGRATLYCGNCYYLLPSIYDQVDAVITDPDPYTINTSRKHTNTKNIARKYSAKNVMSLTKDGNKLEPFDPSPLLHFPKVVLWGANWYCSQLPGNAKWIIWDKREYTTSEDSADCEIAWTNLKGSSRVYRHLWRDTCRPQQENVSHSAKLHPHQKPINLGKFSINECRLEPDSLIADLFAGSGSFVVAALQMGHRVIAVEKHRPWFDILCDRADDAQRQMNLVL